MQIIPVLDIKGGVVVRGMMGDRANYRPIETPLAASSEPVAVAEGLMALHEFPAIYIADLDGIEAGRPNEVVLDALTARFPNTDFWLDAGLRSKGEAEAMAARRGIVPVVGSESVESVEVVRHLAGRIAYVLSLDFRGDALLGPPELIEAPEIWPDRVIVMTLQKVGSGQGPDLARLCAIRQVAGERHVYAAGGVRHGGDLEILAGEGIAGALIATALHDGRIGPEEIVRLS
ncbi:HisA/HisF-related TIM barrel protein [Jiella marina]|uniref:HisA/HisF-related TIM barrel protein n=1 Tax=Jiella sp. LLJ827 TaxID=2917712 RepID=UPI0021011FEB|nr:HisA/HisF-related TIM barrel protein [Jiella sp. LLJ827]MCQ0987651.1 HisA/HisF-related TIM barrel protein [Jiella sp. LLJ827]